MHKSLQKLFIYDKLKARKVKFMSVLMPLYNKWINMIFSGEKTLEFRSRIGKDFKPGTIIYLYESAKNGGCKKVVGQCTIKDIKKIEHSKCDTVFFMAYFLNNILKNKYYLDKWKEVYAFKLDNYDDRIKLSNILCLDYLQALQNGEKFEYTSDALKRKDVSAQISNDCDEWLYKIGYWNAWGETNYNYAIELCDVIKYEKPISLQEFTNNGKIIERAPQSWCYCAKC